MTPEQAQQRSFWKWTAISVGMLAALALVAVTTGAIEVPAALKRGAEKSKKEEQFLDWYCGVSILKAFGMQTDIYRHRVVGAANSDLHPTLTRAYTVGFLPHQTDGETHAFANPPCFISQARVGGLAEAQDHIVRTLRNLNATASATTRPRVFSNALHGPFVALLANDNSRGRIHVVLYAPSHSRDGLVQPNYDALGRAHRWLFRLMTGPAYKIDDPRFFSTNGSLSHVRTCLGAPETTRDVGACSTETMYVACGCIGPACSPRPKYRSANLKRAVQTDIYVAYEIRLDHPAIAGLVSRAANSPRALLRNTLPESAEMRQGMAGALVSPNGAYAAMITARGGLRMNGTVVLPTPSGRIAGSVTIDGKNLALQTVAGDPIAEMQVAEGNVKTPVTLVLKSNGQFAVYDAANADVTSAAVKSVNAAIREDDPTAGAGDGSGYDGDSLAPWDPVADYRLRIEGLLNFLRARDLLLNYDVNADTIDKSALLGALGQSSGMSWGTYDIGAMPPYDPSVNYTERLLALAAVLRRAGLDVPSDAELLATTSFSVQTALGKKETVDASSPMWGVIVNHENATTNRYDPDAEYQKRLAAAFG